MESPHIIAQFIIAFMIGIFLGLIFLRENFVEFLITYMMVSFVLFLVGILIYL